MNDTVKRLMELADEYMMQEREGTNGYKARQALEAELTRLFTPLKHTQIFDIVKATHAAEPDETSLTWAVKFVDLVEEAHGITGGAE